MCVMMIEKYSLMTSCRILNNPKKKKCMNILTGKYFIKGKYVKIFSSDIEILNT